MISCAFCESLRSEKYMYTECNHFVCMNCAALRAKEGIVCCGIVTKLNHEIKQELQVKKRQIMQRLENGYEYEKVQVRDIENMIEVKKQDKQAVGVILRKGKSQKRINTQQIQNNRQINRYRISMDEQLKQTPIQGFYRSLEQKIKDKKENDQASTARKQCYNDLNTKHKQKNIILCRQQQLSPIKMVSCLNQDYQHKPNQNQDLVKRTSKCHENLNLVERIVKQESLCGFQLSEVMKCHFNPVLQEQVCRIRKEFRGFYENLQKLQAIMVYETKIYWEEYIKVIQKERSLCYAKEIDTFDIQIIQDEKVRMSKFLVDSIEGRWGFQGIKDQIERKIRQNNEQGNAHTNKNKKSLDKQEIQLQKEVINLKSDFKICSLDEKKPQLSCSQQKHHLSYRQNIQPSIELSLHSNNLTSSGSNNLEKIYKKLEQSRTKLQQRILVHSEFMNRKWSSNRVSTGR